VSNIAAGHFRRINNLLSSKQAGNPRTYRINSTFKHMHINVCAHAQRRVSKHLKVRLILKVRGLAVDCQKQTVESAESRRPTPTARPPAKGTPARQGFKGNSNRVFSVATNFSTYLTQHLTGQHQHDTA